MTHWQNHYQKLKTKYQINYAIDELDLTLPMTIINGAAAGPTVLITAGVHATEYPGLIAAVELANELEPEDIQGQLIIIPVLLEEMFWQRQAFTNPIDDCNLNRKFPGQADGTITQQLAHWLEVEFFHSIDYYFDLHGGDLYESLIPYVYYPTQCVEDVQHEAERLAQSLDMAYKVPSTATTGAYNYAAKCGVPSLLIERGCDGVYTLEQVAQYKTDLLRLLSEVGQYLSSVPAAALQPQIVDPVYYLTTDQKGCWYTTHKAGDYIQKGEELGRLVDLFGQEIERYTAQCSGVILYQCSSYAAPAGTVLVCYGQTHH